MADLTQYAVRSRTDNSSLRSSTDNFAKGSTMSLPEPYPDLDELVATIGEAGVRLSGIEASEGAAGNISMYIGWPVEVRRLFPLVEELELPQAAPALAGK